MRWSYPPPSVPAGTRHEVTSSYIITNTKQRKTVVRGLLLFYIWHYSDSNDSADAILYTALLRQL